MKIVIIVLYLAAALLPFLGLLGIFRGAREEAKERAAAIAERASGVPTLGDVDVMIATSWGLPAATLERAKCDLWLIGTGLGCGAAASIWSLFL